MHYADILYNSLFPWLQPDTDKIFTAVWAFSKLCSIHGSYYSAEFIFPEFPGQNESFFLSKVFTQNTSVGFQSLALTIETRAAEKIKSEGTYLNCCTQCACTSSKFFSASLLNFCILVLLNSLYFPDHLSLLWLWNVKFPDFPWLPLTVGTMSIIWQVWSLLFAFLAIRHRRAVDRK